MKWYLYSGEKNENFMYRCFAKTLPEGMGLYNTLVYFNDIVKGTDELGPGYARKPIMIPPVYEGFVVVNEHDAKRLLLEYILEGDYTK